MTGSAASDALAVEAHDEPQRAVRGRVLRTEVEDHVAGVELDVDLRVGEVPQRAGDRPRICGRSVVLMRRSPPAGASSAASASSSSPGIGSTSTRPGHGFTTRDEQRVVLAQRVALELGPGDRGGAARGWPSKAMPYISQHSRSCQSAPGYTGTHDCDEQAPSLVDVGLERDAPVPCCVDCTCANTWNRPSEPATP